VQVSLRRLLLSRPSGSRERWQLHGRPAWAVGTPQRRWRGNWACRAGRRMRHGRRTRD